MFLITAIPRDPNSTLSKKDLDENQGSILAVKDFGSSVSGGIHPQIMQIPQIF
jgi:hypothetical protein